MSNKSVVQILTNTEANVYSDAKNILAHGGTVTDLSQYLKLMEHSIQNIRHQIESDLAILTLDQNPICISFMESNKDYRDCVSHIQNCLKLVPNTLERADLRTMYYADLLNPSDRVNYDIVSASLYSTVLILNKGKPYVTDVEPKLNNESKWWASWLPTL